MSTLVLSISYRKGCYRHIKINENATLYELHKLILDVFDFTDDHLHAFFMNNRAWDPSHAYYSQEFEESDNFTCDHKLSDFNLKKDSKFVYIFDFGDEHRFNIKVLRCEDENITQPQIIKVFGKSPEQYPSDESDFYDFKLPELTPEKQRRAELINNYAKAAVNLYGAISLDEFIKLFNSQNEEKTELEEVLISIMRYIYDDPTYILYENYIADYYFDENIDLIKSLLRITSSKPRYIPSKNMFLEYSDLDYEENAIGYAAIRKILENEFGSTPDILDLYLYIYDLRRTDFSFNELSELLNNFGVRFKNISSLNAFIQLFTDVKNNTRLWINNGHTPSELARHFSSRKQPQKKKKIGRNEPCPCGSGKKYKHCCGR